MFSRLSPLLLLRIPFISVVILLLLPAVTNPAAAIGESVLPPEVQGCFATVDVPSVFAINQGIHPTWVHGNFYGDGHREWAVLLRQRSNNRRSLAICRSGAKAPDMIGSSSRLPESSQYLDSFTSWRILPAASMGGRVDYLAFSGSDWCGEKFVTIHFTGTGTYEFTLDDSKARCR